MDQVKIQHEQAERLIDKLLASPIGREVLGKKLGGEILPKNPEGVPDKPLVAALVPCRDHPHPRMQEAFQKMAAKSKDHCSLYLGSRMVSTSVVHWSRNMVLAELIKTNAPWTHVLFIDDDIVPPDDALIRLLSHNKDIIGAVCTTRIDPPRPNIHHLEEDTGVFRQMFAWPSEPLLEVGAVGTGMILISRNALQLVADAFWRCAYEREFYKMPDERAQWLQEQRLKYFDATANAYWFRFLPGWEGTYEMGEDVGFCFIARRYCGLQVFVDTSIQPEHMGDYGYSVKDYLPFQQQEIAKAEAIARANHQSVGKPEGFKLNYEENLVTA